MRDSKDDRGNNVSRWKRVFRLPYMVVLILVVSNIALFGFIAYRDANTEKVNAEKARIHDEKILAAELEAERLDRLNHKYKDKKWYCIGDSITSNNVYQERVRDLCRFYSVTTDSQPTAGMAAMAENVTAESLADIDLVTVFAGMYDFGGNTELGTINDDLTIDTFYGHIEKVIDQVSTLNPKVKLVFITPLKIGASKYGIIYPTTNPAGYSLEQYAKAIVEVGVKHKIQVIDLYHQREIEYNGIVSRYSEGADKIANVIATELEK